MTLLRLTLEYDGTSFRGWARQPGARTVEGVVREALDRVFPSWDRLVVAGRTDSGVHATGQVVSLEVVGGPPPARAAEALNTVLPHDLAVLAGTEAPAGFNARYAATARAYRYVVLASPVRSALRAHRVLWWPRPVDETALAASAALLPGTHDFSAFTPAETEHNVLVRTVRHAEWERTDDELHFTIEANAFLRHMVRSLVGTMLAGYDLAPLLAGRPRAEAGPTAPACGLYLERVVYADDDLVDPFLAGALDRTLTHTEHVRIAIVALRRLGRAEGTAAVVASTRTLCERLDAAERFDLELTERWLELLWPVAAEPVRCSLDDVLRGRPDLLRADLLGRPDWMTA